MSAQLDVGSDIGWTNSNALLQINQASWQQTENGERGVLEVEEEGKKRPP